MKAISSSSSGDRAALQIGHGPLAQRAPELPAALFRELGLQTVSDDNPLNWAVEAGRATVSASPDWAWIAGKGGLALRLL